MTIRRAEAGEHRLLTHISFLAKGYWQYPPEYYAIWRDELTITSWYILQNKVYVAERRDEVVGYYALREVDKRVDMGGIFLEPGFWLEHMFILPAWIGKKVGTELFLNLHGLCQSLAICRLQVLADPNARGFYEKMGFRFIGDYPSTIPERTTPLLLLEIETGDHCWWRRMSR